MPGGTLEKYYQGLNIIGKRLRQFSDATITLYGATNQMTDGENQAGLGEKRANLVRDYFVNIWGIDPQRIQVQGLSLPRHPSNQKDTLGQIENRQVEIAVDDAHEWDILKPVLEETFTYAPDPTSTKFSMFNGINDNNVDHRDIVLTRGGNPWNTLTDIGDTITLGAQYDWKDKVHDTLPLDENPFIAQMDVYGKDGIKRVSNFEHRESETDYERRASHAAHRRTRNRNV